MADRIQSAFNRRQYMQSEDFEIFYYSDLHFQSVEPHRHDYYEFYIYLEGDAQIEIGELRLPLHRGTIALIPPGIEHRSTVSIQSDVPYRRFIFWISPAYVDELTRESTDYIYLMQQASSVKKYLFQYQPGGFYLIQSKAVQLLQELHGKRYGRDTEVSLLVRDLLLCLNRCVYEDEHPQEGGASEEDLLQNLVMYIEQHLEEEISLDQLSEHFYVSKYYIAHLFRRSMGISVHQYIMKKRLSVCRDEILAGTSITRTYASHGFKDYSGFFRAFRKEYGMSPKEYAEIYAINDQ